MTGIVKAGLWFGLYALLIVFPLAVGAAWPGDGAGRPFWTQFGIACGFVAFAAMALEFALISRVQSLASAFGQDALLQFHRQMGTVAAALILIHAALMLGGGYPLEWLNPFAEGTIWAMRWGVLGAWAVLTLVVVSVGRRRLRISYDWWHWTHGLLAEAAFIASLAHLLLFSGFSSTPPMRALLAVYGLLMLSMRLWYVLLKPLRMWSKPWEVVENVEERGRSRTLVLQPVGHAGFVFEPGQFAWLSTGKTPFDRDRHPVSMSSCAYDEPGRRVAFTIKNLGDWSGSVVPQLQPGARIWVDGPYGVFTPDREEGPGYVLIGGGAGVTPLFSMCLTFAERGDARPVVFFFGGHDPGSITFFAQLEELRRRMPLEVVYVLEQPPADWTGESGYITAEILRKHLPRQYKRWRYFVCGPPPLMDSVEEQLLSLGVPPGRIHTERFDIV